MELPIRSDLGGDELLDALLAGFPDALIVTDERGDLVRASSTVRTLLGWSPEELLGQNVRIIIPEPHRSQHDRDLAMYLGAGRASILGTVREFEIVHKDGSLTPCELSVSKVKVPGRLGPHFCWAIRGIADRVEVRKRLMLSEAKFRAVFDKENELVFLLDGGGKIVDANRSTYALTGCLPSDVLGHLLDDARIWSPVPGNRESISRLMSTAFEQGLATGRADIDVLERRRKPSLEVGTGAGEETCLVPRPHAVSIRLIDGLSEGSPRAIVELRDVSDLVRSEQRESAIIRSLGRVGEEASVLAHELRSPVSELEMALRAVARELGEEERAVVEELTRRMRRLEELLGRTLSFSKPIELDLRELPLEQAFRSALECEAGLLRRHRMRTSVRVEPGTSPILADAAAFEDLATNLLRNTAEAQPSGGRIELAASQAPGGEVLLTFEDDGPGIPPERREDVFRVFSTDKEGGTGFGLASVREIAEAHGATVQLDGGAGTRGLLVRFLWPKPRATRPRVVSDDNSASAR